MATMQEIINDILTELRYAPGRDVQIHLQDGIVKDVSRLYRTLMLKYIWRDYTHYSERFLDPTTGTCTTDLSPMLTKYSNILAVYDYDHEQPIQFAPALINPTRFRSATIVPIAGPKVFAVWPVGRVTHILLVSRNFTDKDFELDEEVPFHKDILVLGAAHLLSMKAGTNNELTQSLKSQFEELVNTFRDQELKPQYHVDPTRGGIPSDWYTTDGSP